MAQGLKASHSLRFVGGCLGALAAAMPVNEKRMLLTMEQVRARMPDDEDSLHAFLADCERVWDLLGNQWLYLVIVCHPESVAYDQ